MNRRTFLESTSKASLGTLAITGGASSFLAACSGTKKASASLYAGAPTLEQRPLPYGYKDLEPAIDAATMEIHYSRHAAAYTKAMNEAMAAEAAGSSLEAVLANASKYSPKMRNNAGGHYNHESFWRWMAPGGKAMSASFTSALEASFGSVSDFKAKFADAGAKRFGSGWAWLVLTPAKKLEIGSTANQDNPLMNISELQGYPLLGLDVWEHAYYLKYQNKRADYITAWWNIVNWQEVEARYAYANALP